MILAQKMDYYAKNRDFWQSKSAKKRLFSLFFGYFLAFFGQKLRNSTGRPRKNLFFAITHRFKTIVIIL